MILFLKVDFKYKLTSFFLFLLFSFPYIYLISLWGSIIPTSAALSRKVGLSLDFYNPVYCVTIIAFYIFPFLMCNSFKSFTFLKEKLNKNFFLIIGIFAIYFLIIGHFYEFNNIGTDGKGAFFKLSLILIKDSSYRFIITFFTFILSIIIILMFFNKKKDLFFILYFFNTFFVDYSLLSRIFRPFNIYSNFYLFKTRVNLNSKNILFLAFYFTIFLLGSNYYYKIIL